MLKNRKLFVILTPSWLSLIIGFLLSVGIMTAVGVSYAAGKGSIYSYLFGPGSSSDLIDSSKSTLSALNDTILGNATLNKVLYFAFWMVVGLLVYIILYSLMRGTGAASEELKEASYANIKRERILQDYAIKSVVRLAALFGLIVFGILFIKVLLPYSSLATKNASGELLSIAGIAYLLVSFMILMVSSHIMLVLVRFMTLRVRMFNQQEIED